MSALGHKRTFLDVRLSLNDVRFTPKADICGATRDVRFGPIADIVRLIDHLVSAILYRLRHGNAECLGGLRLIYSSTLVACWTGKSAGLSPLRTRPV